jgi:hypothetical protein
MRAALAFVCLSTHLLAQSSAGVRWTAPSGWKSEAARPMRAATYTVAPSTECAVYFFGPGQGGSVEANIDRWVSQFQPKPTGMKVAKRTIHGLPVTTVDISGSYSGMGGPMAAQKTVEPGYRLLGAIVEAPGGNLFIKFTGPMDSIAANQQAFEHFLNSFEKQ